MKSITKKNKKLTQTFKVNKQPVKATTLKKSSVTGNLQMLAEQATRRKSSSTPSGGRRTKKRRKTKRNRRNRRNRKLVGANGDVCSICMEAMNDSSKVRTLPNCNHKFHTKCINQWLRFNSGCPLCRGFSMWKRPQQDASPPHISRDRKKSRSRFD